MNARVTVLALALLLIPLAVAADSDLHMLPNGTIVASDILVYQKAGTNLFCRATWGSAFFRFVVTTNTSTTVLKDHGEKATIADVKENDRISLTGTLVNGADSMTLIASSIQDSALQKTGKTVSGIVTDVDNSAQTFTLNDKTLGKTTVDVSGTTITKGARTIPLSDLRGGDKVLSAQGIYDYSTQTLQADSVVVYQDESIFKARNFQGTLTSISGTTLPIIAGVKVGGTDYVVNLDKNANILNNAKKNAALSRFVVGDTVRFFGVIRPSDLTTVDAEILRDLNF